MFFAVRILVLGFSLLGERFELVVVWRPRGGVVVRIVQSKIKSVVDMLFEVGMFINVLSFRLS